MLDVGCRVLLPCLWCKQGWAEKQRSDGHGAERSVPSEVVVVIFGIEYIHLRPRALRVVGDEPQLTLEHNEPWMTDDLMLLLAIFPLARDLSVKCSVDYSLPCV